MPIITVELTPLVAWADKRFLNEAKFTAGHLLDVATPAITRGTLVAVLPNLGTSEPLLIQIQSPSRDPHAVITLAAMKRRQAEYATFYDQKKRDRVSDVSAAQSSIESMLIAADGFHERRDVLRALVAPATTVDEIKPLLYFLIDLAFVKLVRKD